MCSETAAPGYFIAILSLGASGLGGDGGPYPRSSLEIRSSHLRRETYAASSVVVLHMI